MPNPKTVELEAHATVATDAYSALWVDTYVSMAAAIKERGEKLVPGNSEYSELVETIRENRKRRTSYEQSMATPVLDWAV